MFPEFLKNKQSIHTKSFKTMNTYGPDRLESIMFDIIDKKIYNAPSRLLL